MYLAPKAWLIGVSFRRLTADEWYVGREVREDKAPFGQPLFLNIKSLDFTASFGVTSRLSLSLTVPFSHGTHSRYYADGARHEVSASGLGDMSLTGSYWLFSPRDHADGNVSLGIGVKAPSGRNDAQDSYYVPGGTSRFTVDQAIQLGDGGWGLMLQAQGFAKIAPALHGYAAGSYLVSPRNQTDVHQSPAGVFANVRVSVPDVFNVRAGVAYGLPFARSISLSLGGRLDGIPMRDLLGRSDGFRRPALIAYLEPGVAISRGHSSVLFNLPVNVFSNFRPSAVDRQFGTPGGGDLAEYLVLAAYQVRF